jgi:uncharacterized membrane protein
MKNRWLPVSTVLLFALAAVPAAADKSHGNKHEHKGDKGDDKPNDPRRKVRETLIKEVGLPEKKAKDAEAVLSKFAPERNKQVKEMIEQRRALRELLQKKSDDDAAYGKALKALRDAQHKLRAAKDQQFDELSKILSPKEQAKVLKAMPELQRRLRDAKDADVEGEDSKELDL